MNIPTMIAIFLLFLVSFIIFAAAYNAGSGRHAALVEIRKTCAIKGGIMAAKWEESGPGFRCIKSYELME